MRLKEKLTYVEISCLQKPAHKLHFSRLSKEPERGEAGDFPSDNNKVSWNVKQKKVKFL